MPAPGFTACVARCRRNARAPGTRAEQAEHMPRDRVQPRALRQFALDIGKKRLERAALADGERRGLAEQQRIDRQQPPRLLIGGAAHHHAVDMREMRLRLLDAGDAAIDARSADRGCARLEPVDAIVIERRDVAVLARRQALRARPCAHARSAHRRRPLRPRRVSASSDCFRILLVDADAAFHRDRDRDRRLHRGDAVADQRRLRHQAGAEAAFLHAVRRAADIEIDLVVAEVRADARALARARAGRSRRAAARPDAPPDRSRAAARDRRAGSRRS